MMKKEEASKNYYLIPIIIFAAIIPLIVLLKMVPLSDIERVNWVGGEEHADFFSYFKSIFILLTGLIALLSMAIKAYNHELRIKRVNYYIPAAAYAVFVILSTLFSPYASIAQWGFVDRYEGAYVIISYLILMFATVNLVENVKHVKIIAAGFLASAALAGIIGIMQFIGFDLFKSYIGKLLILPQQYHYFADKLTFLFDKYTIYSTMYNTNFVGSYTAMLFPISFVIYLAVQKKNQKVLFGLMTCLMFANWIGCRSRAGIVGGMLALILMIILFRKIIRKNIPYFVSAIVAFALIFSALNAISKGGLISKYVSESIVQGQSESVEDLSDKVVDLKNIAINGKKLSIITASEKMTLSLEGSSVKFLDENEKMLAVKSNTDGTMTFDDPKYKAYKFTLDTNSNIFRADLGNIVFNISVKEDGFKILGERGELVDKLQYPESFGFEGKEKFASARGYIWSRSIPLLNNSIFLGTGPDTFAIEFPQKDYVGKLRAFGKVNEIVDKPHNLYLQIGVNTGVVSLIAILLLFAVYFITSVKIYFKNKYEDNISYLGLAMFLAFCGYAAAGMFNDSLVSVAPVFWVVLGLGIACNYIITNVKPEEELRIQKKELTDRKILAASGRAKANRK